LKQFANCFLSAHTDTITSNGNGENIFFGGGGRARGWKSVSRI